MLIFSLHDTSKKGISKFSAIFWPLSASTARCAVASHLFAAKTFTTSGDAFCDANDGIAYDSRSHTTILLHVGNFESIPETFSREI